MGEKLERLADVERVEKRLDELERRVANIEIAFAGSHEPQKEIAKRADMIREARTGMAER